MTMVHHDHLRQRVGKVADQGCDARGVDLDAFIQFGLQQFFCDWAAADVASTYDDDFVDHGTDQAPGRLPPEKKFCILRSMSKDT